MSYQQSAIIFLDKNCQNDVIKPGIHSFTYDGVEKYIILLRCLNDSFFYISTALKNAFPKIWNFKNVQNKIRAKLLDN